MSSDIVTYFEQVVESFLDLVEEQKTEILSLQQQKQMALAKSTMTNIKIKDCEERVKESEAVERNLENCEEDKKKLLKKHKAIDEQLQKAEMEKVNEQDRAKKLEKEIEDLVKKTKNQDLQYSMIEKKLISLEEENIMLRDRLSSGSNQGYCVPNHSEFLWKQLALSYHVNGGGVELLRFVSTK